MIADRVGEVLAATVRDVAPVAGGDICAAYRIELADGWTVFAKALPSAPRGLFAAEARGLGWLAAAGAPVPPVLAWDDDVLVLAWIDATAPSAAAAETLGRSLATLHRCAAPSFGAPWPGYIGTLPLDNRDGDAWPAFYAQRRLLPYLRLAVDSRAVDADGRRAVEAVVARLAELAGPPEPPARIHGDLWSGNVLWAVDGVPRLIDPAAHGGHRETDLAMLALFGAPQLPRILAAYDESFPLADGWRKRAALHQLHPLLVHAALFGSSYGARAASVARALLR